MYSPSPIVQNPAALPLFLSDELRRIADTMVLMQSEIDDLKKTVTAQDLYIQSHEARIAALEAAP